MESFRSSGVVTKQAHVDVPEGLFEEEHGRKGFYGKVSHLYHERPPVGWTDIDGDLRPRRLPPLFGALPSQNAFHPLMGNPDLEVAAGAFDRDFPNFFRNADHDELLFVHGGAGRAETSYGHLPFKRGDYLRLPRGTTYKLFVDEPCRLLKVASASEFEQPDRGLLGPNALYDQTALEVPEARPGSETGPGPFVVEVRRLGRTTSVTYGHNPLDVRGWKGSLYPSRLSIYDFRPVMSHRYHVPPSAHTTFVCGGLVVCSFVARPLEDERERVLKVPFYHSNIDYDEVLFYHEGSFFSRDGAGAGSLTLHPQGIHHGPHPGAVGKAQSRTATDEYAVMIDARRPLLPSPLFGTIEDKDYWRSWMDPAAR